MSLNVSASRDRARHIPNRAERPPGDQRSAADGDQRHRAQKPQAHAHNEIQRRVAPRFRHHAAQPQRAQPGRFQPAVEHVVLLAPRAHDARLAVREALRLKARDGIFAVQKLARFAVKRRAHAVHAVQKIVVNFQIAHAVADVLVGVAVFVHLLKRAKELHLVQIVLHRVHQLVPQKLLQHRMADGEHDHKRQRRHQQQRGRKPQNQPSFQRTPLHPRSSRSI